MRVKTGQGIGSPSITTSVAGQEIIPRAKTGTLAIYDFSIMNNNDCHVSLNGGPCFLLRAGVGYQSLKSVHSCKIQEEGTLFYWAGFAELDNYEDEINEIGGEGSDVPWSNPGGQTGEGGGVTKDYVDVQDAKTLTSAKTYAAEQATEATDKVVEQAINAAQDAVSEVILEAVEI